MYIHIAKDIVLEEEKIIGIFNLDYVGNTREYRNFIQKLETEKKLIHNEKEESKTLLLTKEEAYLTNISVNTISKRMKNKI